jgi:ABC-type multidrug transport system ATPase subunit
MEFLVEVKSLTKQFTEVKAVDDLSFSVKRGEVYGFLGQNGAGKSTTLRMLLTLIRPTLGVINIFGKELFRHRIEILKQVGAVIEKPDLYKYLTAEQNISLFAKLSGIKASKENLVKQLEMVGLSERRSSRIKTFSQGMKQRLGIACALIHNPQFIVLDEPTNGLDPQGIADIRNLILHLSKNEGKTVLVSSHLLSEIELIADSMLIIDKGKKVAEGAVEELLNPAHTLVQVETTDNAAALGKLHQSQWSQFIKTDSNDIVLKMHKKDIPGLNRFMVQAGIDVLNLDAKHSLENYFLSLTSQNQHVAAYQD